MRHEDWEAIKWRCYTCVTSSIKSIANVVAKQLHASLKSGQLAKIGIDEIRAALDDYEHVNGSTFDDEYLDKLEEQTTRRVVELVE